MVIQSRHKQGPHLGSSSRLNRKFTYLFVVCRFHSDICKISTVVSIQHLVHVTFMLNVAKSIQKYNRNDNQYVPN